MTKRCGYERKDPVVYAAQRHQLGLRVRDGMAVRAAKAARAAGEAPEKYGVQGRSR